MKNITEEKFLALPFAEKLAIAKLPANRDALAETCEQVDQHNSIKDYGDAQLVDLAEAHFIMDGALVAQ